MPSPTHLLNNFESSSSQGPPSYCLICCEVADGHHFGAAACRACAAFFRRTVQLNKVHDCPKNGQCFILSNVRNMCRACRYEKCLEVGMQRSSVQQKRDQLGRRDGLPTNREEPVLDTMRRAYEKLLVVRKKVHNRQENQLPRAISFNELQVVYQNEMTVIYQFLCEAFPEYSELLPDTKRSLFKNFFLPFTLLESSYYGYLTKQENVMLIPSGDYVDLAHLESYFNNNHHTFSQKDTISMFAQQFRMLHTSITVPLSAENVDVNEFLALAAIILWESDLEVEADRKNVQEEAVKIKSAIIKDLLFHYQSINVYADVAMRLGAVLSILPSIQRASHRFHEYMEIKNLLNLYALPKNLYDMFSPTS
ncbi:Nuclear hormone receptor family member nhr-53 [Caenorhabditis elegans]|uniref:Nuclear hormone receptor family member nhr-53 n=1 Tax=Caenorhabditis elegans TaxID=6239 RepID=NHR53_CAEEL|nr:Nuclear hormone receptor family member nhr-53 [Caenorhabditis elegans]O17933.3 RecName: Full=Nuclear hormone receptor family member nhr-53 [Caenorhabditis elegans]CAB05768.2 Nuclear hormone receptor family member nhr-53 [Caenorhabditis elegans]|eukprot:NP_741644.1 Nuclear hormone receptor family member nhr-53 [Caenorhabditis elegans]